MLVKMKKMQLGINIFFILACLSYIVPFLILVSISLSSESDIWEYGYRVFPKKIDLTAYRWVFRNPAQIVQAYKITIIFSICSMCLKTFVSVLTAYPLSQKEFKFRNFISGMMFFTMLFSAGLVPVYIWETQYLKMGNTLWIYILPGAVAVWNIFMVRTFIKGIPYELSEAAIVDGANEFQIFGTIIVPLSKPIIATISFFAFLDAWNNWKTAMLYITRDELISLQYFLQRIMEDLDLISRDEKAAEMLGTDSVPSETVRMAMAMVVVGPTLFVFPFFQKYFVKGMTIGSVKG